MQSYHSTTANNYPYPSKIFSTRQGHSDGYNQNMDHDKTVMPFSNHGKITNIYIVIPNYIFIIYEIGEM